MCKLSINNMSWLALMSVVQNKHLPMLESRRYAVRHSQSCVVRVRNYTTASFFPFFTASGFEYDSILRQFQSQ